MAVTQQTKEEKPNIESVTYGNLTWVNIIRPTQGEMDYLAKNYSFHPLALEDCLSRRQLPKLDDYRDYLFIIFPFSTWDKVSRVSHPENVAVFVGDNYLVTVHSGQLKTMANLFRRCQTDEEAGQENFRYGSGYLLYYILDAMIDNYFPVLNSIVGWLDDVEDSVFDENIEAAREVSTLRRDIVTQRRLSHPLRAVVTELERKIRRFAKIDISVQFDDIMDHLNKICETLDEAKEVVEIFKDTDYILGAERLNRIMRVLTILGTILLPFLMVSSIYGMNIPLPGGLERGSLQSFFIILAVIFLISGSMLYMFHRRRWL